MLDYPTVAGQFHQESDGASACSYSGTNLQGVIPRAHDDRPPIGPDRLYGLETERRFW